ncbi:MAG: DUF1934 domain-containing protein [Tissierellales bacterium]|jgi:uncharacterized beta-barrel protein YwiB (DUF1934 family)|nr:DUF1934 domain-containing protein [Tissierellales bacterium]
MKDVRMKVVGIQKTDNSEGEKIELFTEGIFYKKNGTYCYEYEDTKLADEGGGKTKLVLEGKVLTMEKSGSLSASNMTFEKGKKHKSAYLTPYGQLNLEVLTTKFQSEVDDEGKGNIDLEYTLNLSGGEKTINNLHIEIN